VADFLCALHALAAGDLRDGDGDVLLGGVAAELHLVGGELGLATLAVAVVVEVEDWQVGVLASVLVVVAAGLGEAAGAHAVGNFQWVGDAEAVVWIGEVEGACLHDLLLARLHAWLADHAAWVVWILLGVVSIVVALCWVDVALACCVDADLLAGLVGAVAGVVAVWSPWLCVVLWCARELALDALAVAALVIHDVVWSPDLAVDDTWALGWHAVVVLNQSLVLAVAGLDGACACALAGAAGDGALAPFLPLADLAAVLTLVADVAFLHLALAVLALGHVLAVVDGQWDGAVVALAFLFLDAVAGRVPLVSVDAGACVVAWHVLVDLHQSFAGGLVVQHAAALVALDVVVVALVLLVVAVADLLCGCAVAADVGFGGGDLVAQRAAAVVALTCACAHAVVALRPFSPGGWALVWCCALLWHACVVWSAGWVDTLNVELDDKDGLVAGALAAGGVVGALAVLHWLALELEANALALVAVSLDDGAFLEHVALSHVQAVVDLLAVVLGDTEHAVDGQVLELGQDLLLCQLAVLEFWQTEGELCDVDDEACGWAGDDDGDAVLLGDVLVELGGLAWLVGVLAVGALDWSLLLAVLIGDKDLVGCEGSLEVQVDQDATLLHGDGILHGGGTGWRGELKVGGLGGRGGGDGHWADGQAGHDAGGQLGDVLADLWNSGWHRCCWVCCGHCCWNCCWN